MNRREFVVASAVVAALPAILVEEGCTSTDIKGLVNVVLQSIMAVIEVAEPNAPWLNEMKNVYTALHDALNNWTAGGAVQILIQALNAVVAVCAVIPQTAVYAPLIAVLVAGIEAVLNALPISQQPAHMQTAANNNYIGRVALNKPRWYQSRVSAYKEQWNAVCNANSAALFTAKLS
jgi:hypothetical protein